MMKKEEEVLSILKDCQKNRYGNPEDAHAIADLVLCDFLKSLGYVKIVEEFDKIVKFYN
jgi:hypothetical protein